MESLTGVSAEWLAPARPAFAKVLMAAQDPNKSDKEVIEAMEELSNSMPELFDSINHDALANALEEAMGSAAANGAFERLNEFSITNPDQNE